MNQAPTIATGADAGGGPHVNVFDATTGRQLLSFFAYDAGFTGGVRVAVGDVNGDGVPDIITGAGPGGGPNMRVFDGTDRHDRSLATSSPSTRHFTGGVYVAAGDVNGDGFADIIMRRRRRRRAERHGLQRQGRRQAAASFFAYDPASPAASAWRPATSNGDGLADIITGAGPGGGPNVTVFSGADGARAAQLLRLRPALHGAASTSRPAT